MNDKDTITMSRTELKVIIKEAYAEGASQLKKDLGLDDEYAKIDITDLRNFLKAWKLAKTAIWKTIIQYFTVAVISAMIAGFYFKDK